MPTISYPRASVLLAAAVVLAACADRPLAPSGPDGGADPQLSRAAHHSTVEVRWHGQQGPARTGVVAGASASLVRTGNGLAYQFHAAQLTPGNAYTLWLVIVNNPAACAIPNGPCTAGDFFNNPATDAQVRFAAGHVGGGDGRGTFAGAVQEGPLTGWLDDRTFADSREVEVHLVVNDHGPVLPAYMPGMIRTYRGGCTSASLPTIFPPSAFADGEPGPNTCRLHQTAVFLAP